MNQIAFITGATSGIGEATAKLLAQSNFDLILTGRREERLEKLAQEILKENPVKIKTLAFDVRVLAEVDKAIDSLPEEWKNIDLLINNAGLAVGLNPIDEGVIDDWERMIDTNVKGLLYITRKICPIMVKRQSGHIINISSLAGRETYPMGNVYCATKHAVQSLTKGMRLDLLKHGIKVSSVAPGAVDTEFSLVRYKGDKEKATSIYNGYTPLSAHDIAEAILFMATRPKHVTIDDLLIMPTSQGFTRGIHRIEE